VAAHPIVQNPDRTATWLSSRYFRKVASSLAAIFFKHSIGHAWFLGSHCSPHAFNSSSIGKSAFMTDFRFFAETLSAWLAKMKTITAKQVGM